MLGLSRALNASCRIARIVSLCRRGIHQTPAVCARQRVPIQTRVADINKLSASLGDAAQTGDNDQSSSSPEGEDDADEAERLRQLSEEKEASLRVQDQDALIEQLLSVQEAVFREADLGKLATDEYAPVAPNTKWLHLHGMRGVELAVPRSWEAWIGEGVCLGIPFRTYHLAASPPEAMTTVALSVTLYQGAFSSPTLRATPHTGALGVTQLMAQLHQMRRCAPGSVSPGGPAAAQARRSSLFSRDIDDGYGQRGATAAAVSSSEVEDAEDEGALGAAEAAALAPRTMGSWRHEATREDVMPRSCGASAVSPPALAAATGGGAVDPRAALAAAGVGVGGGARVTMLGARTAAAAAGRLLRPRDPVSVFGLDYEAPRWEGRWGGGSGGLATLEPEQAAAAVSADASIGDLRHSVTWIADPAADSVHEITFTAPADAWAAVWAHEGDEDDDEEEEDEDEESLEGGAEEGAGRRLGRRRGLGRRSARERRPRAAAAPATPGAPRRGPAFLSMWGLRDICGRTLVDHVTVTGVPDPHLAAPVLQAVAVEEPEGEEAEEGAEGESGDESSDSESEAEGGAAPGTLGRRTARRRGQADTTRKS